MKREEKERRALNGGEWPWQLGLAIAIVVVIFTWSIVYVALPAACSRYPNNVVCK